MATFCIKGCLLARKMSWSRLCTNAEKFHSASHLYSSLPLKTLNDSNSYRLNWRGIIQVVGRDSVDLLQGLVTSDVTKLGTDFPAQYSMMLNVQGRVICDLVLYNHTKYVDEVCLLVECDASLKEEFIKTIKRYRIRKKVDVSDVSDKYQIYSIVSDAQKLPSKQDALHKHHKSDSNCTDSETSGGANQIPEIVFSVPDPRVPQFGHRLLIQEGTTSFCMKENGSQYHEHRYKWGIPEGPIDLPPGNCLPLESNLVYMNGVSFMKGCYIGQELTARTHHTGVIRKRLVPLVFESDHPAVETDAQITTDKGKNAGKVRNVVGKNGLGLLRLAHVKEPLFVNTMDGKKVQISSCIPEWWPEDESEVAKMLDS